MMENLFKNKYRVASARLGGWDYTQSGYYFVTICVKNRECAFGRLEHDKMMLSDIGKITKQCLQEIPDHFPFVKLMSSSLLTTKTTPVVETLHATSLQPNFPAFLQNMVHYHL